MADLAYIGRVPGCGCLVAAISGKADRKEQAKFVAEMIEEGLEVERVDPEVVRLTMQRCTHEEGQAQLELSATSHTHPEVAE